MTHAVLLSINETCEREKTEAVEQLQSCTTTLNQTTSQLTTCKSQLDNQTTDGTFFIATVTLGSVLGIAAIAVFICCLTFGCYTLARKYRKTEILLADD